MSQEHKPGELAALAAVGHCCSYLVSMLLARTLGVDGFEAYVVASTAFILMVTVTPLGLEKYALRLLPALFSRMQWSTARAFLRFGFMRTAVMGFGVGSAVAAWVLFFSDLPPAVSLAILVSCLSLPAGALVHYGLEVLSAAGSELRATAIFRIVVPASALVLVLVALLIALPSEPTGAMAVACWGIAWLFALLLMAGHWWRTRPATLAQVQADQPNPAWLREARPFWIYRIALALFTQAGVLALVWWGWNPTAVGAYAAAMGTAGLAAMLAGATNRTYARHLSVLLEQGDFARVIQVRHERLRWVLPALAVFLLFSIGWTQEILGLFRPEFVEVGVVPLRLLSLAAAFSVLFALSPTYLKYARRKRTLYISIACAGFVQVLLLAMLVPAHGAAGAAAAYATAMVGLYSAFAITASSEVRRLQAVAQRLRD